MVSISPCDFKCQKNNIVYFDFECQKNLFYWYSLWFHNVLKGQVISFIYNVFT